MAKNKEEIEEKCRNKINLTKKEIKKAKNLVKEHNSYAMRLLIDAEELEQKKDSTHANINKERAEIHKNKAKSLNECIERSK